MEILRKTIPTHLHRWEKKYFSKNSQLTRYLQIRYLHFPHFCLSISSQNLGKCWKQKVMASSYCKINKAELSNYCIGENSLESLGTITKPGISEIIKTNNVLANAFPKSAASTGNIVDETAVLQSTEMEG